MAPNAAVNAPARANSPEANGAPTKIGASRMIRNPPALTMPACMNADTGVGVSMVSGNQLWKGNWADFIIAAATSSRAMICSECVAPPEAMAKSFA